MVSFSLDGFAAKAKAAKAKVKASASCVFSCLF